MPLANSDLMTPTQNSTRKLFHCISFEQSVYEVFTPHCSHRLLALEDADQASDPSLWSTQGL